METETKPVDLEALKKKLPDAAKIREMQKKLLPYLDLDEMDRIAKLRSTPEGREQLLKAEIKIDTRK